MSLLKRIGRALQALARLPYFWRQWNVIWRAQEEGDWPLIERTVRDLHRHHFETPETRFLYACSLMHLSRWQEALVQFEMIEKHPLKDPLNDEHAIEAARWFNHALTLRELGRADEAVAILKAHMSTSWPSEERRKAETLLRAESELG